MDICRQLWEYVDANAVTRGIPADYEDYIGGGFGQAPTLSAERRDVDDLISVIGWDTSSDGIQRLVYAPLSNHLSHAAELRFAEGTQTSSHTHNYVELVYVVRGRLIQKIKGKTVTFSEDEICLVDRETIHSDVLLWEDATVLCLGVDDTFFSRFFQTDSAGYENTRYIRQLIARKRTEYSFVRFVPKEKGAQTMRTFENIFEELLHTLPGKTRIIKGYVERLVELLSIEYRIELNRAEKHELGKAILRDVIEYVEQNYPSVTVQELADIFRYNPDYLSRQCLKKTGMNLSQLIQKVRVEKAFELLESTELSVDEIARQVGYNNLGFFYKKFKEHYHTTPNNARNEL